MCTECQILMKAQKFSRQLYIIPATGSQIWADTEQEIVRGPFLYNNSRCVSSDIRTVSMNGSNVQSETI